MLQIYSPDENLKKIFVDGMYFQVDVITDTLKALAIPSEAIIKTDGKFYVLVKDHEDDDNIYFKKEEIRTDITTAGYTRILGNPLKDVIIKGTYYFQN